MANIQIKAHPIIIMGDNSPLEIESDSWCRTTSGDPASTTFTWTSEDFLSRPESFDESTVSSTFTVSGPNDKVTTWELEAYPRGEREAEEDEDEEAPDSGDVPLYIRNAERTLEKAKFSFSILNGRHQKVNSWEISTEEYSKLSIGGKGVGCGNFVSIKELKDNPGLLPGGSLSIVCDLTVYGPVTTISGSKFPDEKLTPPSCGKEINDRIGKLLGEKKFSDVKITCGEEAFDCHRNILSVK